MQYYLLCALFLAGVYVNSQFKVVIVIMSISVSTGLLYNARFQNLDQGLWDY